MCEALASEWYDAVFSEQHVACYLHRRGLFQSCSPELCTKVLAAMMAAGPGGRGALQVRCIELHAYAVGGGLFTAGHKDNGSQWTLIVQLSAAADFDGGRFVTWHEGGAVVHRLRAGDGLLIPSEKLHNVAPVTRGLRHSLVVELWTGLTNTSDRFR